MNKIERLILCNQELIMRKLLGEDVDKTLKQAIDLTAFILMDKQQCEECSDGLPQEPKEFVNSGGQEQ